MINLKLLARELNIEVADLRGACKTLNLPLAGEEVTEETAEILKEIGKQAQVKNATFQQAVQLLSTEQARSTGQADSTQADSWRDRYNQERYGTTKAAPGSVKGVMLSDQETVGEVLAQQRLAAVLDYSTAALFQGLTHGEAALGLGKSEAADAIASNTQQVQDLMANLVRWKPKQLPEATPTALNAKQLKPSSM